MSDLHKAVQDYLAMRRSLGFALERDGELLPDFVDHLGAIGATAVTIAAAVDWAREPVDASPAWWSQRLTIVRGFAGYLHGIDARHQVPPRDLLAARRQRIAPYLYSPEEIVALMDQAARLRPSWRATCHQTLIGLLATTGLRLGEALSLDRRDVDLVDGWVLVHSGKGGRSREVALHETTTEALGRYCRDRDRQWPDLSTAAFFISTRGARLGAGTVHDNFRHLLQQAGLAPEDTRRGPRPHDLRHTFAVHTLLQWYQQGEDVDARLPLLSTWLGHVDPASTYWYLQASPELLAVAAMRLEQMPGALS